MKSFLSLDFFIFIHPLLIVLVAGIMLLFIGCVRVIHRLPTPDRIQLNQEEQGLDTRMEIWKRCVAVRHLELQFPACTLPPELQQAEIICREAGL